MLSLNTQGPAFAPLTWHYKTVIPAEAGIQRCVRVASRLGVSLRIAVLLVPQEWFPMQGIPHPVPSTRYDSCPMIIASINSPGFQLALE